MFKLLKIWFLILVALLIPASQRTHMQIPDLMHLHFGWGIRDRLVALVKHFADIYDKQVAMLSLGDITTEYGAKAFVLEMAKKAGRNVNILRIVPFVKTYASAPATGEQAQHAYWVATAILDLNPNILPGIRSDSYHPIVVGFITDTYTGKKYAIDIDLFNKFLSTGDISLIQSRNVLDTRVLDYQRQGG